MSATSRTPPVNHQGSLPVVEVEKRKWDGSTVARELGLLLEASKTAVAWVVPAGTRRERPGTQQDERVPMTELWLTPTGRPWIACASATESGALADLVVHASLPIELRPGRLGWVDLDLDLHRSPDGTIALRDIDDFAAHAAQLGYPGETIRAAWVGISDAAHRLARGHWPFDGTLERMLEAAVPPASRTLG